MPGMSYLDTIVVGSLVARVIGYFPNQHMNYVPRLSRAQGNQQLQALS